MCKLITSHHLYSISICRHGDLVWLYTMVIYIWTSIYDEQVYEQVTRASCWQWHSGNAVMSMFKNCLGCEPSVHNIVAHQRKIPLRKKICFSHWESQWDCSKIKISMRSWARTSLRIKNLIKNLIKNQDLGQDLIEILIEILNEDIFLIENLIENLNAVLSKILIFDEVLDEVLDFWWGSWWGSWFSMRFLPKTSLRS